MDPSNHLQTPAKGFLPLLMIVVLFKCSPKKENSIDYLGQKPPGMVAELFAPGLISTAAYEHSAPAFSPDGSVVLWTVLDKDYHASMVEMKYELGKWSAPYRPSFADSTADDYYPSFSPDGKKLYFSSRRKVPSGYPEGTDIRIWEVERNQNSWDVPMPFDTTVSQGQDYAHSVTKNGTLYFSSALSQRTNFNIRKAEKANNRYVEPTTLPYNINSVGYEDGPFIAPDENFLIFESDRHEGIDGSLDLYISFKNKDGRWAIPINMGPKINSAFGERFARLSPDGKYLFFGSTRAGMFDIYWINAQIIEELRSSMSAQNEIESSLGEELLISLDANNLERASALLKEWLVLHPNTIDAVVVYCATLRTLKRYAEAEELLESKAPEWNENVSVVMETALAKLGLNKDDEAATLLSPILMEGDQQENRYKYLANALLEMGKFKVSDEFFDKAMAIHSNMYEYYRRARAYALIGEQDKAFENLNKAVEQGYTSKQDFEDDTDLGSLKSDARWTVLIEKLK